jgi:hypothetical protein
MDDWLDTQYPFSLQLEKVSNLLDWNLFKNIEVGDLLHLKETDATTIYAIVLQRPDIEYGDYTLVVATQNVYEDWVCRIEPESIKSVEKRGSHGFNLYDVAENLEIPFSYFTPEEVIVE